jgi:hypothetical protein
VIRIHARATSKIHLKRQRRMGTIPTTCATMLSITIIARMATIVVSKDLKFQYFFESAADSERFTSALALSCF